MSVWRMAKLILGWASFLILSIEVLCIGLTGYVMRTRLLSAQDQIMAGAPPWFSLGVESGSGFYIGRNEVLTNRHVVASCRRVTVGNSALGGATATVVAVAGGFDRDLAVIRTEIPSPAVASFALPATPDDPSAIGETGGLFRMTGYPARDHDRAPVTETMEGVEPFRPAGGTTWMLSVSGPAQGGSSGSPLFDRSGHVVGIEATGLNDLVNRDEKNATYHRSVAASSSAVIDWLGTIGIHPAVATGSPENQMKDIDSAVVKVFCFR